MNFADFVGNGTFTNRWAFWYMKRPLIGALVALLAYSAIGGGVIGLDAAFGNTGGSLWGLTGICLLSGMFSRMVTDKMREVFGTLLAVKPQNRLERNDKLDDVVPASPTLEKLEPATVSRAAPVVVRLIGTGFSDACMARLGDADKTIKYISPTELELPVTSLPAVAGVYQVAVVNPATQVASSPTVPLTVVD